MKTDLMTIGALARAAGLSRSALLYYDRLGLVRAGHRTAAGYRLFSQADAKHLKQICLYRQMGIALKEIGILLREPDAGSSADILQRRLRTLDRDIAELRQQQRCIVEILKQKQLYKGDEMITKKRWVEIMKAAGFSEEDMHKWHARFEQMEPEGHQEFLESLGITPAEIAKIRELSRKPL